MSDRMLDVDRTKRARTSKALVRVALDACPQCNVRLPVRVVIDEPALLRHGGYGETRRTVAVSCECGWHLVIAVESLRPDAA